MEHLTNEHSHLIKEIVTDSNNRRYFKLYNDSCYTIETNPKVIQLLEEARINGERVRITLGDVRNGKAWDDKPETGTIGRSKGDIKIPLLIKTKRSFGGGAILTHCIVKLEIKRYGRHYLPCYQTMIPCALSSKVDGGV